MPRHKTATGNLTRWPAPPVDRVDVAALVLIASLYGMGAYSTNNRLHEKSPVSPRQMAV